MELTVLRDMLEFVMRTVQIGEQVGTVAPKLVVKSLLDRYIEEKTGVADRPGTEMPHPHLVEP